MLPIRKAALLLILFFTAGLMSAQKVVNLKWEPKLAFSSKISDRWGYNLQAGGLQYLNSFPHQGEKAQAERVDVRGFLSYTFFRNRKLSVGYMYRRTRPFAENPGYEHRLTLQYSFQHYLQAWRLGHRVAGEQRWRNGSDQSRLRYRLSGDVPLQGEKLDVNELYFLASDELVLAMGQAVSLENRLSTSLGWQLTANTKIELGAQYRFRGKQEADALHLLSNLYVKL